MKNHLLRCCFCLLLCCSSAHAGWLDSPDSLQLQSVGSEMRLNGIPMNIRYFITTQPAEQLLKQFQDAWERNPGGANVKRSTLGTWTVLNQGLGDEHRSVQVRNAGDGQIEGYLALTSPQRMREPVLQLRLPSGLQTLSVLESTDSEMKSQQVTAVSKRSVDATASVLENTLRANGWKVQERRKTASGTRLAADKGNQDFDAALTPDEGGAVVMMNTVTMSKR
jgi:hypothetical protein